jgi:hypothetical protein
MTYSTSFLSIIINSPFSISSPNAISSSCCLVPYLITDGVITNLAFFLSIIIHTPFYIPSLSLQSIPLFSCLVLKHQGAVCSFPFHSPPTSSLAEALSLL